MVVHRPGDFYARVALHGLVGFGESYQAGDWDASDLFGVLKAFASRIETIVPRPLRGLRRVYGDTRPTGERNTPSGSRSNIARHYDLSNWTMNKVLSLIDEPTV